MATVQPLAPEQLYQRTDPAQFNFETTADLPDQVDMIGQPRAVKAVNFGIGIQHKGYNIFALGPTSAGKQSLVTQSFIKQAVSEPVPPDWCYVHNFQDESRPNAIQLPAGKGAGFQRDINHLVEELRSGLANAFESDEYRARRQMLEEEFQERQEKSMEEVQSRAREQNISVIRTPGGIIFAPTKDGEVITPEEFQRLSQEERERLEKVIEGLQSEMQRVLQQVPGWQREAHERLVELNQEITRFAINVLIEELRQKYGEFPEVVKYLGDVQEDVVENAQDFLQGDQNNPDGSGNPLAALIARARQGPSPLKRFQVNLLVDNSKLEGAPVIYEDNPTYQNLLGRVEHMAQMGALVTDFTLIKPGALHRANGGYLVLDVRKVLLQPYAWEGLKRELDSRLLHLESIGQMLSLITTVSLEPEPIPLDVKVALLGDRMLYYLLQQADPEFHELFKVQADFEDTMDRSAELQGLYAQMIATIARRNGLKPLEREAVTRVIEHSSRMAGDAQKLTAQVKEIADVLREADYWAGEGGSQIVQRQHVQQAIDEQIFRADRLRERFQENILRETILVDTTGSRIGQINGLSVLQLGGFAFGNPSRITARVRMGKGDVINIEREVDLSGPIHSKGVLILSGFLGARYASERPLALTASLVFEQSYSGVDGDSASSAELYALLSAIAEVPIKQSLAVTGSINQHGDVQAIGGVNEKIEGFFDICKARGLTGDQGVLIPVANVKHLMLRQDVVEAVAAGSFHIYPVEHVDQGIELLTGIPAGEPAEDGSYPEGTINGLVMRRLEALAEKQAEREQKVIAEPKSTPAGEEPEGSE